MTRLVSLEEARSLVGQEVGVSEWMLLSQERVNQFAEATGDFQFIHMDDERARNESPFGGTVAHGFLTLSLLSMLAAQADTVKIEGIRVAINYGLDKVRFMNPVRTGKRIRARFKLLSVDEKGSGQFLMKQLATVEIEGESKPAMIAEWLGLSVL